MLHFPKPTRAIWGLLIANGLGFLLQMVAPAGVIASLLLWPIGSGEVLPGMTTPGFMPWQLVTSAFLHADIGHLLFNMLALWMFGTAAEQVWGERRLLIYYAVCVLVASVCQLLVVSLAVANGGPAIPTLGASGGVYGLVLAYAMLFPQNRIFVFPIPIPIKARTMAIGFVVISLWLGMTGRAGGIAHFAHLGGMLGGWLMIRYWRGQWPGGRGGPRRLRSVR